MQQLRNSPRHLSTAAQRDLAGLMALYEENYIRLRTLLPHLAHMSGRAVSSVPGCVDLHVELRERARYTTTLNMTCLFRHGRELRREPDLTVRICHDARTAEVLDLHLRHTEAAPDARRTLQVCWQRNRFLHKWLGYCLRRGHRFPPDQRRAGRPEEPVDAV
jgi:uncharacterized protein